MENNNSKNLRRILGTHLKLTLKNPVHVEVLDAIISAVESDPAKFPALSTEYAKYFCDFCGKLHDLEACPNTGAGEYRVDPEGWARRHLPAIFRRQPKPTSSGRALREKALVEPPTSNDPGVPDSQRSGGVDEGPTPVDEGIPGTNQILVCSDKNAFFRQDVLDPESKVCQNCGEHLFHHQSTRG